MPSFRGGIGGFLKVPNLRSLIKISPPESKIIKDRGIDFPNLFRSPGQGRGIFLKARNLKSLLKDPNSRGHRDRGDGFSRFLSVPGARSGDFSNARNLRSLAYMFSS